MADITRASLQKTNKQTNTIVLWKIITKDKLAI